MSYDMFVNDMLKPLCDESAAAPSFQTFWILRHSAFQWHASQNGPFFVYKEQC